MPCCQKTKRIKISLLILAIFSISLLFSCEDTSSFIPDEEPPESTPDNYMFVKGGTFEMGDPFNDGTPNERPIHKVTLSDFYMSKYEVTFEAYDSYCNSVHKKKPDDKGWGRGKRPVIYVTLSDAKEYCKWLSQKSGKRYRLPTEAEWEYAARVSGRNLRWSGTNNPASVEQFAWIKSNSGEKTHPVGEKKPNGLGLYDMTGNVDEWVTDRYGSYSSTDQVDPTGPLQGTTFTSRGGSWSHDDYHSRNTWRGYPVPAGFSYCHTGFRIVLEAD